jgi:hypothetical protein
MTNRPTNGHRGRIKYLLAEIIDLADLVNARSFACKIEHGVIEARAGIKDNFGSII